MKQQAARDIVFGDEPLHALTREEKATRFLIAAFFVGPPLFVFVELSPTASAIAVAIVLLINNPRLLFVARAALVSGLGLSLLSLGALGALSALWSQEPARSLIASVKFCSFVLLGAVIVSQLRFLSNDQRRRIWFALSAGSAVALVVLAVTEIQIQIRGADTTSSIRSFHKTTFYGLFFAAILLFPNKRYLKFSRLFVLVVYALPTVLFGRSSGTSLMIICAVPLVFFSRNALRAAIGAFCVIYVALALVAPFSVDQIYRYADSSRIASLPQMTSYMGRLELWKELAPEIRKSPWIGHGANMTRAASVRFGPMKYYDLPDIPSAHNMIFDVWYELGLTGVIALLSVILFAAVGTINLQAGPLLVTAIMLLGTIVELSVDHRIWLSWVQAVVIFATAASVLAALRDGKEEFATARPAQS